jgi:hypothetical protein
MRTFTCCTVHDVNLAEFLFYTVGWISAELVRLGGTLPSFRSYDDFVACERDGSVDMRSKDEGFFVGPADGKDLAKPIGGGMVVKIRDEDTAGAYSVYDNAIPPGSAGPRIHRRHEEAFYVLEGDLSVQVGPRTIAARWTLS